MGAAAELERGLIRTRLARGKQRKAARGGYVGGARLHRRYGYLLDERPDGGRAYVPVPKSRRSSPRFASCASGSTPCARSAPSSSHGRARPHRPRLVGADRPPDPEAALAGRDVMPALAALLLIAFLIALVVAAFATLGPVAIVPAGIGLALGVVTRRRPAPQEVTRIPAVASASPGSRTNPTRSYLQVSMRQ